MKRILKTSLTAAVSLLLVVVIVLSKPNNNPANTQKQCQADEERICHFGLSSEQTQQVIVKFAANVQVEELNELQVSVPTGYILEKTWIQGINMYMGQIAVFAAPESESTNNRPNHHRLQFFLGACSEPNMRWQLVLVIKKVSSQQLETFFVNFKTDLP